ncbi:MAG: ferredoxin [Planctomycetes bacterium]|nr:ferredoxin [Planctomycetota bacterium]
MTVSRREFLRASGRGAACVGLGAAGTALALGRGAVAGELVWQIDPGKCVACGNCETHCVLQPSAVKWGHTHAMCGRCAFCFGYYDLRAGSAAHAGVEYQLCPTHAIERSYLGGPYFEYVIDEGACIGCGLCVKGCTSSGNGSLFLQVRHPRRGQRGAADGTCVNCNECAIARSCPSGAFVRVPADDPYPFGRQRGGGA